MKKPLLSIFTFLLFLSLAEAQAPQAFKYQAVVRDAGGQVISGSAVGLQISLIADDGIDTATVYVETHDAVTNDFGLVNLEIGRGMPASGDFSQINWGQTMYVQIGLDPAGGSNYETMGVSELLSVPYALQAGNVGVDQVDDADADPTNELQDWTTLPGIPADIADGDQVDDADADPTNELELPTDAQAGDIVYHDGSEWTRVPKGRGGQMLTLDNNGTPYWSGPSTEGLLQTVPSNGQVIYVHPTVNNVSLGFNPSMTYTNLTGLEDIASSSVSQAVSNDFDGEGNTAALVTLYGDGEYAAKVCYDLEAFGFDDWYLPSAGEMEAIFRQYSVAAGDGTFGGQFRYWTSSPHTSSTSGYATISYGFQSGNTPVSQNGGKAQVLCIRK